MKLKRWLSIALVLCMVLALLPAAFAEGTDAPKGTIEFKPDACKRIGIYPDTTIVTAYYRSLIYKDAGGNEVPIPADAAITMADPEGTGAMLYPSEWQLVVENGCRPGTVTLTVTAGGFASTSLDVEILPTCPVVVESGRVQSLEHMSDTSNGGLFAAEDEKLRLFADAPAEGMAFDRWEILRGDPILDNPDADCTDFLMPACPVELKALYKEDTGLAVPARAVFYKAEAQQKDLAFTLSLTSPVTSVVAAPVGIVTPEVKNITFGEDDYTVSENQITLKKEALAAQHAGQYELIFADGDGNKNHALLDIMPKDAVTLALTIYGPELGTVTLNPALTPENTYKDEANDTVTYEYQVSEPVTLTAAPAEDARLNSWREFKDLPAGEYWNSSKEETYVFYPSENGKLDAFFEPIPFKLSADAEGKDFGTVKPGYTQPAPVTFTVTNTGYKVLQLAEPVSQYFDITTIPIEETNPRFDCLSLRSPERPTNKFRQGETASFTVQPKADLPVGVYDETITVYGIGDQHVAVSSSVDGEITSYGAKAEFKLRFEVSDPVTITATAQPAEGGTVTGTGTFNRGTEVSLQPEPAPGWHFLKWMENGEELDDGWYLDFTAEADRNVVAVFEKDEYGLSLSPAAKDFGTAKPGYTQPEAVTIEVTNTGNTPLQVKQPTAENYIIGKLDYADGYGPQAIQPDRPVRRSEREEPVILFPGDKATFTVQPKADLPAGDYHELIAVKGLMPPYEHNDIAFEDWEEAVSTDLTADFKVLPETYEVSLTARPEEGGTVSGAGAFEPGKSVTVKAEPKEGWKFVKWIEGEKEETVCETAEYTFSLERDRFLTAVFEKEPEPPVATAKITFKVVNGTWADGTTADKVVTVELPGGKGTLKEADVPAGMKAKDGYEGGKWDKTPDTAKDAVTVDLTYTFTFQAKAPDVPKTGGNSHLELWIFLSALSLSGITALVALYLRKKHRTE